MVFIELAIPKSLDKHIQFNRQAENQVPFSHRRCTTLSDIELMQWIKQFGRWNVQEFVAHIQDIENVLTYLRAERTLELTKVMPFVTSDSVTFEKRSGFPLIAEKG